MDNSMGSNMAPLVSSSVQLLPHRVSGTSNLNDKGAINESVIQASKQARNFKINELFTALGDVLTISEGKAHFKLNMGLIITNSMPIRT